MQGRDLVVRLRPVLAPLILLALIVACGSTGDDGDDDGPGPDDPIELEPSMVRLTVPLGSTVTQGYTVYSTSMRGVRTDITAQCALSLDATFGTVAASVVTVLPHGGETLVRASCGARTATSQLIVDLGGRIIIGPNTPANAPDLFVIATPAVDPLREPRIEYPFDRAVTPVNMPALEPQWTAAGNDLFHIILTSEHASIDVYTTSLEAPLGEPDWAAISYTAAGGDLRITVEGLAQASPSTKYASAPVDLVVSRDAIDRTAIYYWASSQGSIMSQTFGAVTPATQVRDQCTSCHSLSRTGTRLGYSRCVGNNCSNLFAGFLKYDRNTQTWVEQVNADGATIRGSYSTFAPVGNPFPTDDQALAIVSMQTGNLQLYDPDTGQVVPSNLPAVSTHGPGMPRSGLMADWSPDGASVVYASTPNAGQWIDLNGGAIARLDYTYSGGTHTFGEPQFLVTGPITLPNGSYTNFFFPSYSGDGTLIVFNGARATWRNFTDARAAGQRLFLSDAAGTWSTDLTKMNGGDVDVDITWPHWAPGATSDYQWVVFASQRDYGHKLTTANTSPSCIANGVRQCKQIWIGAISKATLAATPGVDPSAPPMWLPGQNYQTNNISPYWTADSPIN